MLAGDIFDVAYRHKTEISSITAFPKTIQAVDGHPHLKN
jgi:hypothetical protein